MKDVVTILKQLIALPSINPMGVDGTVPIIDLFGESRVNEYIHNFIKKLGMDIIIQETGLENRKNVGGMIYKGKEYKTIILQAHTDTVDIGNNKVLLRPVEKNGKIFGRGACDDKGGFAAMLSALAKASKNISEIKNNIIVIGVADEEWTWKGGLALGKQTPTKGADFGIIAEPTSCKLINGFKGVSRWDIITTGKSVHSSNPEKGVNAIYNMAKIINLIDKYQQELLSVNDSLLGNETISVGKIKGGTAVSVVPESCVIEIDHRLTRKTTPLQAQKRLVKYLKTQGVNFKFKNSKLKDAEHAVLVDENNPGIKMLSYVSKQLGMDSNVYQVAYGSDAFRMNKAGIPTVLWGPGSIDVAHGNNEYVEIRQLHQAMDFYYNLMKEDLRKWK
jgi:acetylornithine deacetylase